MAVDQFCLKWNNFQKSIISAFESLQVTEDLADVTLTCEGINVKAHKIILSACSPYFRTVFKENPCPHPIVILKDVQYVDLLAILNFMYHGEVLVSKDQLKTFLQTAEVLQVSGLNGYGDFDADTLTRSVHKPHHKCRSDDINANAPTVPKKIKLSPKSKSAKTQATTVETVVEEKPPDNFELVEVGKIKTETSEEDYGSESVESEEAKKSHGSILEAALEIREESSSILERSLLSSASSGKPATGFLPPTEEFPPPSSSDTPPKCIYLPKKEKLLPVEYAFPAAQLTPTREDQPSGTKPLMEPGVEPLEPPLMIQAHHSSQCGSCPHCGKVYSNQSSLKYHVRLVHSDLTNMYCCHLCPESFDYREGFKKHMADVHSVRN